MAPFEIVHLPGRSAIAGGEDRPGLSDRQRVLPVPGNVEPQQGCTRETPRLPVRASILCCQDDAALAGRPTVLAVFRETDTGEIDLDRTRLQLPSGATIARRHDCTALAYGPTVL